MTSYKSTLPEWDAKVIRRDGRQLVGITCPRCGGKAIVSRKWLSEELNKFKTRTCTYCYKTAWLPGEHPDGKEDGHSSRSI